MLGWDVTVAVLFAAALHAGWNALIKGGSDPLLDTALLHGSVALPAIALLPLLPWPSPEVAACLLGSTGVHCLYMLALAQAYRSADLSVVYPVMRGSAPIFTALAAGALLGEWPTGAAWSGIALICTGVLSIGLANARGVQSRQRRHALGWALLTATTIVAYTMIDSHGARAAQSPWAYVVWLAAMEGSAFLIGVAWRRGPTALIAHAQSRGLVPLGGGIASMGSYGIALWAMTHAPIASIAALRETSVLFALVIASRLLREPVGPIRWAGALTIVAGIVAFRLS